MMGTRKSRGGVHRVTSTLSLFFVAAATLVADLAARPQAPLVKENATISIAGKVYVIPDQRVNRVPNIGIIVGERGVMVVDTGMGPQNAQTALNEVRKISNKKILFLTLTHFHPEHGMGAQAFPPETTIIYPKAQKEELFRKGEAMIERFSGDGPEFARLLEDVKIVSPDVTYSSGVEIDLGGTLVQLLHFGAAHTLGDNFVFLPQQKILFGGDVVLNRFFPIMADTDANGSHWIQILEELEKLSPLTVVPGHGAVGDASLITALKEYLVSLRNRVQQLSRRGQSLEEIEAIVSPEFQEKYKEWDNPRWLKNAIQNFAAESSQ